MGAMSIKIRASRRATRVAFERLETLATGDRFAEGKTAPAAERAAARRPPPTQSIALHVKDRKDEVRLAAALAKLIDEDRSLGFVQDAGERRAEAARAGRDAPARDALERLAARFGVEVETTRPSVAYRETIRDDGQVRGRHKKQSGGHGQFGDVLVEVAPRARGEGFAFAETVHGGTVPRNYFSARRDRLQGRAAARPARLPGRRRRGDADRRLLSHGRFLRHGVPRRGEASRIGEALPKASPVLLEPILAVDIDVPSDAISRATALVSAGAARSSA